MAIIVVGGSNQGAGKTDLVCGLIAALKGYRWNAVKVCTHYDPQPVTLEGMRSGAAHTPAREPRGAFLRQMFERPVVGVSRKKEPAEAGSAVWEETVAGDGSDTGRYLAAGAARALLVTAPEGRLSEGLNQLWPQFGRGSNFIFESNSVVHHVRADVCLLIHGVAARELPLPEREPSFLAALRFADALVARAPSDRMMVDGLCLAGSEEPTALRPVFQLRSLERLSPEFLEWIRPQLPEPQHL